MNDDAEETTHPEPLEVKQEKPRGKCTVCAFEYQLGTARTGEHKGELVVRKHNSRTGPGLCEGAQRRPKISGCTLDAGHDGLCDGQPCGQPDVMAPENDAFTGPIAVGHMHDYQYWDDGEGHFGDVCRLCGEEPPYTATAQAADVADGIAVHGALEQPLGEDIKKRFADFSPVRIPYPPVIAATSLVSETEIRERLQDFPLASITYPPETPAAVPGQFTAPAPASDIPESTTTVSGQPDPDRDRWGRYLILGKPHTRATTFAKLGANPKAIGAWNERNVIRGLTLRYDLLMLANGLEVKRDRNELNSIASQAKEAAGSKVAANIGTAYHAFTERLDADLITFQDIPYQYQGRVFQYDQAIKQAGLTTRSEWIERTTAVRADQVGAPVPVAGTLDRIFQMPDGSLVIGDLKTGSDLSHGEMEIEVQLAVYAHGVNTHGLFDWNTKTWQRMVLGDTVRTDIAIVVHLPADGDGCTLYVADIERGWRDAQRLGPLQASLKEKKRFRGLTAGDLAPAAAPVGRDEVNQSMVPVIEPPNSHWEQALRLLSSAPDRATVAQLYQYAMDSGLFHADQLSALMSVGRDRLSTLGLGVPAASR